MTRPQHKQVGQHGDGDANRFFGAVGIPTDFVLPQSQPRLEFPMQHLSGLSLLIHAHHLSRRQLGQIGHQAFGMLGTLTSSAVG